MFTPFSMNAARTRVRCVSVDKRDASQLTSIAEKWVHIISVQRPRSNSHSGRAPAQRSKLPREISAAPSLSFSIIVFPFLCSYLFCLPFYCLFFVNYNICEDNFGDTGQHWCKAQKELRKGWQIRCSVWLLLSSGAVIYAEQLQSKLKRCATILQSIFKLLLVLYCHRASSEITNFRLKFNLEPTNWLLIIVNV